MTYLFLLLCLLNALKYGRLGSITLSIPYNHHEPESSCHPDDWTEYFNADNALGKGDFEILFVLRRKFPEKICSNPTAADGRVRGTLVHNSLSGQRVAVDKDGLVCKNENQVCVDYEVRFCCPKIPECINGEWTPYFNVDSPSGECDCELLSSLQLKYGEKLCERPTAIDARTSAEKIHWQYTSFKDHITVDNEKGFRCDNTISEECDDFEIRLCCPTATSQQCGNEDWTPWFNSDNPSGQGDFETIAGIDQTFPEEVCSNPSALEVRSATSGELFNLRTVSWNVVASTSHGFSCFNKPGLQCDDYVVRFCCPKESHIPECKRGKWSDYFDIDDPSEYGDFETVLSFRQKFPDLLCETWEAVDAKLVGTDIHHPIRGQQAQLSVENGFSCKNEDNPSGCGDYEIRFCCLPQSATCEDHQWTDFFDVDNQDGPGDFEDFSTHLNRYSAKLCSNPTAIDVRTENGAHYTVLNQNVHISLKDGFRCYNDEPTGQKCCDYKVRYCCPTSEVCQDECSLLNGTWTDFYDLDDPSTVSTDACDCELLSDIRAQYPSVCKIPVAIDARLLNGDYYTVANQVVALSPVEGFKCLNNEQEDDEKCRDYKVRFCCSGGWSDWGEFTPCTALCGGGQQMRTRQCWLGASCPGAAIEEQDCNTHNCEACGLPDQLTNGVQFSGSPYPQGTTLDYSCNGILEIAPAGAQTTCQADGTWTLNEDDTGFPTCYCPSIPTIERIDPSLTSISHLPDTDITYSCQDPIIAKPVDVVNRCDGNTGEWFLQDGDAGLPECRENCGPPDSVSGANIEPPNPPYDFGDTAAYICSRIGAALNSPGDNVCQNDGCWSLSMENGNLPECE